jgi:hypothetical protein
MGYGLWVMGYGLNKKIKLETSYSKNPFNF